jgi:hypothetical protein
LEAAIHSIIDVAADRVSGGFRAQYWPPLSEYRAPSWSWASIEGPIEFNHRFDLGNARGLGARLISCEVVPLRHQTPLEEVQSGKAVLEASSIPARDVPIRDMQGRIQSRSE